MNQRIKELAKQAELYAFVSDEGIDPDIEKFAQLIVRECADIIEELAEKLEEQRPNKGYSDSAWHCAEIIKEHFGVDL